MSDLGEEPGGPAPPNPFILGKKEEMTGKKPAGQVHVKQTPPPPPPS